jgi:4-amino-4-deoxy-L-arabinose transferase-like glycosyltransferase
LENLGKVIKQSIYNPRVQVTLTIVLISLLYFITLSTVPFHPDEATDLYMSDDFDSIISDPLSMAYHQGQFVDSKTHYRLMDPPMIRLYLGMARNIAKLPPITNDWDWTASWEENIQENNYPPTNSLLIGRFAIFLLFPFTCYFVYAMIRHFLSHWASILATIFFALNPLTLLHARHAMTEAVFLFFSTFLLMLITDMKKHLLLIPIMMALAINSKQTAVFIIPAYGIHLIWSLANSQKKDWLKFISTYSLIPIAITFLLNPIAWSEPIPTIQAAIAERKILMEGNQYFLQQNQPERLQLNLLERMITVIYHTAYEQLAFDDIPNYREAQKPAIDQYNQFFYHNHSRNLIMGTILVISLITILSIQLLTCWKQRKSKLDEWFPWIYIYVAFFSVIFGLSFLSSIYQRYVIILLPFIALFLGWFLESIFRMIKKQPV